VSIAVGHLLDSTPAGVSVLNLLNDAGTDVATLDVDARLRRDAAVNLVAYRDGADGQPGTADDNLYRSIDEVDAVPRVGPATLEQLVAFAASAGYLPGPDDVLGVFEGHEVTVIQAEAVLRLANEGSQFELQIDAGLDSRAVTGVFRARPIRTMNELSAVYFIGPVMMGRLLDYVGSFSDPQYDCRASAECREGFGCQGVPFDGSSDLGICRPRARVDGEGDECSSEVPCGAGLVCAGLTVYGDWGLCQPGWMAATVANDDVTFIPADPSAVVSTSVVVRGQASVPEDIVVTLDLPFEDVTDLTIELVDPNGTVGVLWDGPNETEAFDPVRLPTGISRDDVVNGRWTLNIRNVAGRYNGRIDGWTLFVTSRFD